MRDRTLSAFCIGKAAYNARVACSDLRVAGGEVNDKRTREAIRKMHDELDSVVRRARAMQRRLNARAKAQEVEA